MKPTSISLLFCVLLVALANDALAEFKAGAAVVDVTPTQFPVLVNGGMTSRRADKVVTPINARAIVLDDGQERIGIVVVDSCMMPRPLLDEAKALAAQRTKIRPDRMLISASHSHTAPACMGCLGHRRRSELCAVSSQKTRRSPRGRRGESRTGPGGLGRRQRRTVHGTAALDSPARSNCQRSVRKPNRASEHARRQQLG